MSPQIDSTEQVLDDLNEALKTELTAVHQYLLHSRMCHNWGYPRLAEYNRKEAIEEFAHAEQLIDRILFLKGIPVVTELFEIREGANVKDQIETDLALEIEAVARLNAASRTAAQAGDNVTRQLFDRIMVDEDHHIDYLEGQLHAIGDVGLGNYLALQMGVDKGGQ